MSTHKVNDIVRGNMTGELAVVREVLPDRRLVVDYLNHTPTNTKPPFRWNPQVIDPVHPDAVGQHVRFPGKPGVTRVISIGQGELVTLSWGTFFRTSLIRVADPTQTVVPTDAQVDAFKRAWEQADREGKYGDRTRAGLAAVLSDLRAERDEVLRDRDRRLRNVQDELAATRTEHGRVIASKEHEIERLERDVATSAEQRSEVRDCYIQGGMGLELKETPGAHITIKGADIAPRGTIGTLKNRADLADAEVERLRRELRNANTERAAQRLRADNAEARIYEENDKGGEARAVVADIARCVGVDLSEGVGQRWSPESMNRVTLAVAKIASPDPDAAAKAALARFHDVSEEDAEQMWGTYTEVTHNRWRRVAAS